MGKAKPNGGKDENSRVEPMNECAAGQTPPATAEPTQPGDQNSLEPRPYFGLQQPDFAEGGGFGRHEYEPHYRTLGGQVGGRGPLEPPAKNDDGPKARDDV